MGSVKRLIESVGDRSARERSSIEPKESSIDPKWFSIESKESFARSIESFVDSAMNRSAPKAALRRGEEIA